MVGSRSAFEPERAPCGKTVGGDCYRDKDGEGLVVYDLYYDCGCRRTRHEYHDGTVTTPGDPPRPPAQGALRRAFRTPGLTALPDTGRRP